MDSESAQNFHPCETSECRIPEHRFPVNVSWLELRRRRVAAIGVPQSGAHSEAVLRKIQPVANGAPNPIKGRVVQMRRSPGSKRNITSAASLDQVSKEIGPSNISKLSFRRKIHSDSPKPR